MYLWATETLVSVNRHVQAVTIYTELAKSIFGTSFRNFAKKIWNFLKKFPEVWADAIVTPFFFEPVSNGPHHSRWVGITCGNLRTPQLQQKWSKANGQIFRAKNKQSFLK